MIKILDKIKNVWYYIIVSTLKMLDTEPEIQKYFAQININDFCRSLNRSKIVNKQQLLT